MSVDCIFCTFVRHEIIPDVVFEDDRTLAFLDLHPRTRGHTIVIPRTHYEMILDIPELELGALFIAVKKVTALLKKNYIQMVLRLG